MGGSLSEGCELRATGSPVRFPCDCRYYRWGLPRGASRPECKVPGCQGSSGRRVEAVAKGVGYENCCPMGCPGRGESRRYSWNRPLLVRGVCARDAVRRQRRVVLVAGSGEPGRRRRTPVSRRPTRRRSVDDLAEGVVRCPPPGVEDGHGRSLRGADRPDQLRCVCRGFGSAAHVEGRLVPRRPVSAWLRRIVDRAVRLVASNPPRSPAGDRRFRWADTRARRHGTSRIQLRQR